MTYTKFLMASVGLAALANITAITSAAAQDSDHDNHDDTIIVTASPIVVSAEDSVAPATVLDAEDLVDTFNGPLGDSLENIPGISTTFFGPASSRPVIRGLGGDRIRILTNGLGVLDASAASPDHAVNVDVLGAQQLEILHGPAAIAYGGNAIGGVINIQDGLIAREKPDGASVTGYAGTTSVDNGTQIAGRAVLAGEGPFVLTLEGVRREGDDYDISGFAESALQMAMEEENDHEDDDHDADHDEEHDDHDDHDHEEEELEGTVENSGFLSTSRAVGISAVGDAGYIGFSFKRLENEYGLPGHSHEHGEDEHDHDDEDHDADHDDHEDEEGEEIPPYIEMVNDRIEILGGFNGGPGWITGASFGLGLSDYTHTEFEDGAVGTVFLSDGYEGRVKVDMEPMADLRTTVGVQVLRRDFEAVGDEAYITPTRTEEAGLFAAGRYEPSSWGLEFGARIDTRELDNEVSGKRSFDTFSLSGGAFQRWGDGSLFTAISVNRTERAPTDAELFANGPHIATDQFEVGDSTLDTETATSVDVSARWHTDRAEIHGTVYASQYDGFIDLFPTGAQEDGLDVFQFQQTDAEIWGVEVSGEYEILERDSWDLDLTGSAEYVSAETDNGNLPRIPPLKLTAGAELEVGDQWTVTGLYSWADEQTETAEFELPTDSWQRVDLRVAFAPFDGRDIDFIIEGRNLTDEEIRYHTSYLKDTIPAPGRSVRFAVRGTF